MKVYTINDAELRDPKREWYDAEEADAEIKALKESSVPWIDFFKCNTEKQAAEIEANGLRYRAKTATEIVVELRQRIEELERKLKDATAKI